MPKSTGAGIESGHGPLFWRLRCQGGVIVKIPGIFKAKLAQKTESEIQSEIMAYLSRLPTAHFYRTSVTRRRGFHPSELGQPDVTGCYKGRYWAFEVKRRGKKQSQGQLDFQGMIDKAGGRYFTVYSLDDVISLIEGQSG